MSGNTFNKPFHKKRNKFSFIFDSGIIVIIVNLIMGVIRIQNQSYIHYDESAFIKYAVNSIILLLNGKIPSSGWDPSQIFHWPKLPQYIYGLFFFVFGQWFGIEPITASTPLYTDFAPFSIISANHLILARVVSILFSSLAIWIFFKFVLKKTDCIIAFTLSFLLMSIPLWIQHSSLALAESFLAFFVFAAVAQFDTYIETEKLRNLIITAVFSGLATASKITGAGVVLGFIIVLISHSGVSKDKKLERFIDLLLAIVILGTLVYSGNALFREILFRSSSQTNTYVDISTYAWNQIRRANYILMAVIVLVILQFSRKHIMREYHWRIWLKNLTIQLMKCLLLGVVSVATFLILHPYLFEYEMFSLISESDRINNNYRRGILSFLSFTETFNSMILATISFIDKLILPLAYQTPWTLFSLFMAFGISSICFLITKNKSVHNFSFLRKYHVFSNAIDRKKLFIVFLAVYLLFISIPNTGLLYSPAIPFSIGIILVISIHMKENDVSNNKRTFRWDITLFSVIFFFTAYGVFTDWNRLIFPIILVMFVPLTIQMSKLKEMLSQPLMNQIELIILGFSVITLVTSLIVFSILNSTPGGFYAESWSAMITDPLFRVIHFCSIFLSGILFNFYGLKFLKWNDGNAEKKDR